MDLPVPLFRRLLHLVRKVDVYLLVPAIGVVVWGELRPQSAEPFALWDKLLHFTAYFGLALMATIAVRADRRAIWGALGLIAMGGALEILQGMTGRDADFFDEVANTIGVVSGLALGWIGIWLLRKLKLVEGPPAH